MKLPRGKLYIDLLTLIKCLFKIFLNLGLSRGPKTQELENTFSKHWNRNKCLTTSTCRLSLYYVLKSLNLKEGDEVLLTPIQIPDFMNVILDLKLKPVFIDINNETESVDLDDLESKINKNSKVLLATYLTGLVPDIKKITNICHENSIFLIEDISHSYGSFFEGKKAGSFGFAAIGSLSPGKIISSIGGGFILIDDYKKINVIEENIKNTIKSRSRKTLLKVCLFQIKVSLLTSRFIFNYFTYYIFLFLSNFYKKKFDEIHNPKFKYFVKDKTIYDNPPVKRKLPDELFFEFTDLQAEVALKTFKKNLENGLEERQKMAKILYENLNDNVKKFIPKLVEKFNVNAFWHFPIIVDDKDFTKLQKHLLNDGYDVVGYAMKLCNEEKEFMEFNNEPLDYSKKLHKNSLFLPMFKGLKKKDMINIANSVNKFFLKN